MVIQIDKISERYINQLKKSYFNKVDFAEASNVVRKAVEEVAEAVKDEIKQAVEPLKSKVAQKDEFISSQTKVNEELEKENKELQTKLNEYKPIIKEAYKQGITQDIRDKKNALASILSGLFHQKEELNRLKIAEKPVVEMMKDVEKKPVVQKPEKIQKPKNASNIEKQDKIEKPVINSKIIRTIETQRKNQKLDSVRINKAQKLIKELLEDAPQKDSYSDVQKHFEKTMNNYLDVVKGIIKGRYRFEKESYSKIRLGKDEKGRVILKERGFDFDNTFHPYNYEIFNADGTSIEIYSGNADSYITFRDTEGEELLKICYSDRYSAFIYDKNGRLMVTEGIKDGAVEYLNVNFNEVEPVKEIENDKTMNAYAQDLINKAKKDCKKKENSYNDITNIDYINPEGKRTVHEYYVNKKINPNPVSTYLYNPKTENLEKIICAGDFGINGKIVDNGYGGMKIIQYSTKGITSLEKRRADDDLRDFRMGFYKDTENEHFEVQSLYDKNYVGDKDRVLQRAVYEKRNYGLASKPLTRAFTFHDLTKHQIKPWDFSILKPYL